MDRFCFPITIKSILGDHNLKEYFFHPLKKRDSYSHEDHGCGLTSLEYILWKTIKKKKEMGLLNQLVDSNKLQTIVHVLLIMIFLYVPKKNCHVQK